MSDLKESTRNAIQIQVRMGANQAIRTFLVAPDAEVNAIGMNIMVKEHDNVRLLVPINAVVSILPVIVGNQVSAREFASGKPLSSGNVVVLSIVEG